MDGAPPILSKATFNNTATDARMLANAKAMPAPAATRKGDYVGHVTQIDGWDSGTTSLLGNKYLFACYDAFSTDFDVFPSKVKSSFPQLCDRYFRELKLDNEAARQPGGLWSEAVAQRQQRGA